jgi:hypothetical protein
MIRQLNPTDIEIVRQLVPKREMFVFKETFLSELRTWYAFGIFDDNGKLLGITTANHTNDLPEWYLLKVYCEDAAVLSKLVKSTCDHFKNIGLNKFYWMRADYDLDFMLNFIPDEYITIKDYSINPWLKSPYQRHQAVLQFSKFWAVKNTVYMSILSEKIEKIA